MAKQRVFIQHILQQHFAENTYTNGFKSHLC